jgi:hypothetical protein
VKFLHFELTVETLSFVNQLTTNINAFLHHTIDEFVGTMADWNELAEMKTAGKFAGTEGQLEYKRLISTAVVNRGARAVPDWAQQLKLDFEAGVCDETEWLYYYFKSLEGMRELPAKCNAWCFSLSHPWPVGLDYRIRAYANFAFNADGFQFDPPDPDWNSRRSSDFASCSMLRKLRSWYFRRAQMEISAIDVKARTRVAMELLPILYVGFVARRSMEALAKDIVRQIGEVYVVVGEEVRAPLYLGKLSREGWISADKIVRRAIPGVDESIHEPY